MTLSRVLCIIVTIVTACIQLSIAKDASVSSSGFLSRGKALKAKEPSNDLESLLTDSIISDGTQLARADNVLPDEDVLRAEMKRKAKHAKKASKNQHFKKVKKEKEEHAKAKKVVAKEAVAKEAEANPDTTESLADLLKTKVEGGDLKSLLSGLDSDDVLANTSLDLLTNTLVPQIVSENNLTKSALAAAHSFNCSFDPGADVSPYVVPALNDGNISYEECRTNENQTWTDYYAMMDQVSAYNQTINDVCPCTDSLDCSPTDDSESYLDYIDRMVLWLENEIGIIDNRTALCNALNTNKTNCETNASQIKDPVTDAFGQPASPCCNRKKHEEDHVCNKTGEIADKWTLYNSCWNAANSTYGAALVIAEQEAASQMLQMRLVLRMQCLFGSFDEDDQDAKIEECKGKRYENDPAVKALEITAQAVPTKIAEPQCPKLPGQADYKSTTYTNSDSYPGLPVCPDESCPALCNYT
eukprot:TRINITY_DN9055_c0_g1_i1.p1 TRINITY_DN9055_c0_g1~~TRINITY_DN9055_c0_g1_i1.p1  ORF type:complete len:471 (+),score=102.31 TRINITY_DN9055_c0_g1_i1:181-1593(+)